MKVCIILPKGLPVPATKGGAIETLIHDIVICNEKYNKLDITVVSTYEASSYEESKEFKNTKFIYIDTSKLSYKVKALKVRIANLFGKHLNTYNECVLDEIKNEKYDYIIVEDGAYHSFKSYLKYFKNEQMILHFHHNGESDKYTDETFSRFIGVSSFVTNTFKKTSSIKNCEVLKNGIKIDKFKQKVTIKEKEEIRKKLGFSKDDFVVIFCGRLIPEKGVLELIKAINMIDNEHIKLMIVGSINFGAAAQSEYLSKIEGEVNKSNGRIKATGFVPNNEVYKYYKTASIGVVPSVWEDAAPLVTVEIMASGLPLIITKTGGAPEYASKDTIIVPKDDKIPYHLKEAIENLYKNSKLRDKMSEEGIKKSEEFTTENFYFDFVNLFLKK